MSSRILFEPTVDPYLQKIIKLINDARNQYGENNDYHKYLDLIEKLIELCESNLNSHKFK
jgi:hypothetical protein